MNAPNPEIIPIGWNRPAIELVAEKLREIGHDNPEAFRKATLVVPTSESGHRLKEYMAQMAGRPVLMPRTTVPWHLIEVPGDARAATPLDTAAAWFRVLQEVRAEVEENAHGTWFPLFPKAPVGNEMVWVSNMAAQLQALRNQMQQECLTLRYADLLRDYYPDFAARRQDSWKRFLDKMQDRWSAVRKIFSKVDAQLKAQGLTPAEEALAQAVEHPAVRRGGSLVILACVPELSPLQELYLRHCAACGQHRLLVLLNAPESELCHFDAFGRPLVLNGDGSRHARWLTNAIPLCVDGTGRPTTKGGLRHIHLVPDADAMGARAVELAGGLDSADVAVAACDSAMAPAIHTAFLRQTPTPWVLNLPSGLSLSSSEEGQLAELLVDALGVPYRLPNFDPQSLTATISKPDLLAPLVQLLRNAALQQAFTAARHGREADLTGFNARLDQVLAEHYPAHPDYLLRHLQVLGAAGSADQAHHLYALDTCNLLQQCWKGAPQAAQALRELSARLRLSRAPHGGSLLADALSRTADFFDGRGSQCTPQVRLCLLGRELADAAGRQHPLLSKENTNGDLVGWRELPFCRGSRLIVCGMHNDCVPERPHADIFLPDELRCSIGIASSESRTARDSYLLTALLHGHPGRVDFILARTRADGTAPAPSTLLLRCGEDKAELATRAAHLFHESKDVFEKRPYGHWPLLGCTPPPGGGMGNVSRLVLGNGTHVANRFAAREHFSPSFLRGFLACPLRFWLGNLLGLDPGNAYPDDFSELQPNVFGSLMHDVLNKFVGNYPDAAHLPKGQPDDILARMKGEICAIVDEMFQQFDGSSRIIMRVQRDQLMAAMASFAAQHYTDLTEGGWRNAAREREVKHPFTLDDGTRVQLAARIDRIDYREREGRTEWRIIDYKSSSKTPDMAHYAKMGRADRPEEFRRLLPELTFECTLQHAEGPDTAMPYRWTDLQLPIYAEALKSYCAGENMPYSLPELGYFNIPRGTASVQYTTLHIPADANIRLSEETMEQAMQCTRRVISLIRRGDCLYSAEQLELDSPYAQFGALTPDADPRSLCGLNEQP